MPDKQLINKYLSGDEKAVALLIEKHKRKIFSFVIYKTNKKDLSEEICHLTWIKVFDALKKGKYKEEGKFDNWLIKIASNVINDYLRELKNKKQIYPIESEYYSLENSLNFSDKLNSENIFIKKENFHKIKTLINKLPNEQREIIVMHYFLQMTFKEIAELLNISINTALGRMRYALINLRKLINKYNVDLS